jgi:hypothetical protein
MPAAAPAGPELTARATAIEQRERALQQRERELAEQRRILAEEYRLMRSRMTPAAPDPDRYRPSAPAPLHALRQETLWDRVKRMFGQTTAAID